jgi:general secretion pathway protein M
MSVGATTVAISPVVSRSLALALLLALAGLLLEGIAIPTVEHIASAQSEISRDVAVLEGLDATASRLPRLEEEETTLKSALQSQGELLEGLNDSLVAATLQSRIKSVVDGAHAELRSTQILPRRDENGFRRYTARVEMTASADELEHAWYAMEAGAPYLFVDNFDINARQMPRPDGNEPPLFILDVRFEVSAYARAISP